MFCANFPILVLYIYRIDFPEANGASTRQTLLKSLPLYLHEIIGIALDFDSHLQRLEVLKPLDQARLKLKPVKCELFKSGVQYLRNIASEKRSGH